jgi:hypothetical protein
VYAVSGEQFIYCIASGNGIYVPSRMTSGQDKCEGVKKKAIDTINLFVKAEGNFITLSTSL